MLMDMVDWLFAPSNPRLEADERVILETLANRIHRIGNQPGRLVLTNDRVLFLPLRFRLLPRFLTWSPLDLDLDRVVSVTPGQPWALGRWLGGLPGFPVVVLRLDDAREILFQTKNARRLQEEIESRFVTNR